MQMLVGGLLVCVEVVSDSHSHINAHTLRHTKTQIFSEEGNTLRVELFEKNDSMPGASINKQLVRMGVAERVPESNVSQVSLKTDQFL